MENTDRLRSLIARLDASDWSRQDEQARLATLQELENIMAGEQGRPAYRVEIMDETFMKAHPNARGVFDGRTIRINRRFFRGRGLNISGLDQFGVAQAVTTLIHEGRHAWQHYVAEHGGTGVDERTRAKLRMNFLSYVGGGPGYSAQLVELDARRYAEEQLRMLCEHIRANTGMLDKAYLNQLARSRNEEQLWARSVIASATRQQLEAWDELARARYRARYPDEDPSDLSMFEDAKKLLEASEEIARYVEGKPIAYAEQTVGERLDGEADRPDALEREFWRALKAPEKVSVQVGKKGRPF